MDHEPTVWPIEWGELLEFCNSAGYRCRLEPRGSLLIPPDYNVSTRLSGYIVVCKDYWGCLMGLFGS
jgi:hypothetical protein